MREHLIYLPTRDNSGKDYSAAIDAWEREALDRVGGYTKAAPRVGAWRDDKTGAVYNDVIVPHYVACDDDAWQALLAAAFKHFPDQLAIYTAVTGDATIAERPN